MTNLISFYDKVTYLVDEGKAVDVVYLEFSKVNLVVLDDLQGSLPTQNFL